MRKIGDWQIEVADSSPKVLNLLMRQFEQLFVKAKLIHHLEGRRMDRVAAKIAEEIGVLFEHQHIGACAGEDEAEHHAGGPSARDAAPA